jgi:phospholipid/cholesterol/gamma-HCH transport system ATP-binding protein
VSDPEIVIRADRLAYGYGPTPLVKELTFDVRRPEVFIIGGPSGCGKSTLLKTLTGLLPPLGGTVTILGRDPTRFSDRERRRLMLDIGMLFQQGALFSSYTVEENTLLPALEQWHGPEWVLRSLAYDRLKRVQMELHADKYPAQLSGGQRKRVALARAMMLEPSLLFCDEPSAGLDPKTSGELDALLASLRDDYGLAVVVVTHDVELIQAVGDRMLILNRDGGAAFFGTARRPWPPEVEQVLHRPAVGAGRRG